MKRNAFVLSTLVLLVFALAGAWRARAQEGHTVFLPIITSASSPGETIKLEWASSGGVEADLVRIERGGPIAEIWDVPLTGTFTHTIATHEREYISFHLTVINADAKFNGAGLTIPLTCPDVWFFEPAPEGCPGAPALFSAAAEQPFEHGLMVWMEGRDGIYVLFDDDISSPRWSFYEDTWEEGEGEILCDRGPAPAGRFYPRRGFGKLWCKQPGLFDRLGWATAEEVGYAGAVQRNSVIKYTTAYVRAADGNVYKLLPESSGWERIIVTGP